MSEINNSQSNETSDLSIYSGMNEVFKYTRQIIDSMNQGDKISIKDLTDKVASQVDMSNGHVMNLIQLFCKRSSDVTIEVGRGGGIFKGGKKKRIDPRARCETCGQVVRPTMPNNIKPTITPAYTDFTNL